MSQPQMYTDAMDNAMRFDDDRPVAAAPAIPLGDPTDVKTSTLQVEGGSIPVTMVGGKLPGNISWVVYSVPMAQLVPATTGTLRTDYDPAKDASLSALANSIKEHGGLMQPLLGRLTGKTVQVNGEEKVVIEIWAGIRRYHALKHNMSPTADVRLLKGADDEAQMLLFALAEQEVRKSLSLLDVCDTARRLHRDYQYGQQQIGLYLGYGETNAQTKATDLIRAAEQSDQIRRLMASEDLTLTHVVTLIERIPDTDKDAAKIRDLAARYAAQEKLSTRELKILLSSMQPLPNSGMRAVELVPALDNKRIIKQNAPMLSLPAEKPSSAPAATVTPAGGQAATASAAAPATPFSAGAVSPTAAAAARPLVYWKRGTTLLAQPTEIEHLAHARHIVVQGPPASPVIDVDSLGSHAFFASLDKRRQRTVPLEQLEAELLADLEAIRATIEDQADEVQGPNVVPMVAPQRPAASGDADKLTG